MNEATSDITSPFQARWRDFFHNLSIKSHGYGLIDSNALLTDVSPVADDLNTIENLDETPFNISMSDAGSLLSSHLQIYDWPAVQSEHLLLDSQEHHPPSQVSTAVNRDVLSQMIQNHRVYSDGVKLGEDQDQARAQINPNQSLVMNLGNDLSEVKYRRRKYALPLRNLFKDSTVRLWRSSSLDKQLLLPNLLEPVKPLVSCNGCFQVMYSSCLSTHLFRCVGSFPLLLSLVKMTGKQFHLPHDFISGSYRSTQSIWPPWQPFSMRLLAQSSRYEEISVKSKIAAENRTLHPFLSHYYNCDLSSNYIDFTQHYHDKAIEEEEEDSELMFQIDNSVLPHDTLIKNAIADHITNIYLPSSRKRSRSIPSHEGSNKKRKQH